VERDLEKLLKALKPQHNVGDYVYCVLDDITDIDADDIVMAFKEKEGNTIIIRKELADRLKLAYSFVASWITLTVHSSLEAVGLTAAFSQSLSENGIGCNVVAAFYHDHIFVDKKDTDKAMEILSQMSK
jgi:hypothetical protein